MKSMKGRILKKLKFIPSIHSLKHGLVPHLHPTEKISIQNLQTPQVSTQEDHKNITNNLQAEAVSENILVSRCFTGLRDEELGLELDHVCGKVNIIPSIEFNIPVPAMDNSQASDSSDIIMEQKTASYDDMHDQEFQSLSDFEEKCPPGGYESIILYTTSLRGIRKTFEDCQSIRFLLQSFRVVFYERDVSMHLEFREELWRLLGGRVIPPRLFIKGKYIGGAEEAIGLHEQGKLKKLLEGIPLGVSNCACAGCGNMRFVVCSSCNGSRKCSADGENDEMSVRCTGCNENGLVKCPICS